jgi:hypothetical protein
MQAFPFAKRWAEKLYRCLRDERIFSRKNHVDDQPCISGNYSVYRLLSSNKYRKRLALGPMLLRNC